MKKILTITTTTRLMTMVFIFILYSCSKLNEQQPACTNKDRWDVKTLSDQNGATVNFNSELISISNLISIPETAVVKADSPRFGIEFKTYTINCHIREYKLSTDGDYHLVLQDLADPSITMIGEIPDPYCETVKQSIRFNQITQARTDFKNSLLVTGQVDTSIYTITGIAFYDKVHGQLGAAPNAIEIHPILSIIKH